ncbi:MAG TPA: RNA 2',3'-cyclic phosphodiesterase [Planctomycetota bacterium]
MRCFFGLALPDECRTLLHAAFAGLRAEFAGRNCSWVAPANLHVTLRYLGESDRARLQDVTTRAEGVVQAMAAPRLRLGEAGLFPARRKRPFVLWAGLQAEPAAAGGPRTEPGSLDGLARGLEQAARLAGFAAEQRAWRPHITLARLRSPAQRGRGTREPGNGQDDGAADLELRLPLLPEFAWSPDRIELFRSVPGPQGVDYPSLRSFAFFRPSPPPTLTP